jgi:hypothetical protein
MDTSVFLLQQPLGHPNGISDADAQPDMQLAYEREPDQCFVRNAPSDSPAR